MTYIEYRIWDNYKMKYTTAKKMNCIIMDNINPKKAEEILQSKYEENEIEFENKEICIEKCEEVTEIIDANKI